ncbi:hypothetical protein GGS20DRAFT_599302 [Poronia punctata]|nr:hypothetical protein GGS20DRAFT_599302 [Poronia punctata]
MLTPRKSPGKTPSGSPDDSTGRNSGSAKRLIRKLTGLGKKSDKQSEQALTPEPSPKFPTYPLTTDTSSGKIALLKHGSRIKKDLDLNQTTMPAELVSARSVLQTFREAYTRDIPEVDLNLDQNKIDLVARYLKYPCDKPGDESETSHLARYSDDSLFLLSVKGSPGSREYADRWNVLEARRRVRKNETVIQDFHQAWDAWVSEQTADIQKLALRDPVADHVENGTKMPFGDYYNNMMIAAIDEVKRRKDIAEGLILQYPDAFPGFMDVEGC